MHRTVRQKMLLVSAAMGLALFALGPAPGWAMGSSSSSSSGSMGMSSEPRTPKQPTETRDWQKAVEAINEGQYEEAITKLKKLEKHAKKDPDVLNYLGYTHRKLGKNEEALAYYQRALASDPAHKGAHEYLGELYLQMGDVANAEAEQASLEKICNFSCTELGALKAAIADHKAKAAAGGATKPAT